MLFLLDSNITIKSDPLSQDVEPDYDLAMTFQRLVAEGGHRALVHPSSRQDAARDPDAVRRAVRLRALGRYPLLQSPPRPGREQVGALGVPPPGSNDAVDQDLLAAVVGDAAELLVTEDDGIHRKARRLSVAERVLRLTDAVALIEGLFSPLPAPPPAVRRLKTHELDRGDPIWESLRADYDEFDDWLAKASREQRDALVVDGAGGRHAAVALLKPEPGGAYGKPGPLLKISTFKVAADHGRNKYGELLLKAVFEQCAAERLAGAYLTVFERHGGLVQLLDDFGFARLPVASSLGEAVLHKSYIPTDDDDDAVLPALDFHVRYGPPRMRVEGTTPYVVPIEPRWHRVLFPDAEPGDALFGVDQVTGTHPFGNALRKAYLCHAKTRSVGPGDPLLFYRSHDHKAVFVVGVCEAVHVGTSARDIAALVGQRTVYTYAQIEAQIDHGQVLVLLFRQCRVLRTDPMTLGDLVRAGALKSHPQSVTAVRPEGTAWLRQRLDG